MTGVPWGYVVMSVLVAGGWVVLGYGGRRVWDWATRQGRRD